MVLSDQELTFQFSSFLVSGNELGFCPKQIKKTKQAIIFTCLYFSSCRQILFTKQFPNFQPLKPGICNASG